MSHVCVFWHGSFASSSRRVSILSKLWSYIHRSNPQNLFFKEALLSSNSSLTYLHCSLVLLFINNFRFSFALYLLYPNTLPTFNNCNIHNDTIVQKLPNSWNPNSTTFSISLESHWMKLLTFPH